MNALDLLYQRIVELSESSASISYRIPSLWVDPETGGGVVEVNPFQFFKERISSILDADNETPIRASSRGEWTRLAVVYNMFVRLTSAWDHDGDGVVSVEPLPDGFRETGTFLKSIVLLPFLKRMGINTIHLLPVASIGKTERKGTLGSPYAIRNPYDVEPLLSEPVLNLGVETECAAFVEAAHRMGMRVVMEFVFRTTAKDCEWVVEHPNWFYWIDAAIPDRSAAHPEGFGNPQFNAEELRAIHLRVAKNDINSLPPPPPTYRRQFSDEPDEIEIVDGNYIGTVDGGRRVRIPGAFADWPPDDVQPPWNDVTYLKLYDHPSFNYIAYNTVRIYDARLQQIENENRGVWNTLINIIPHYQRLYSIDGVMIDMGHALPKRLKHSIIERARRVDPDFAFWEENFAIASTSREEGYNAAIGYLWSDEHLPHKVHEFCRMLMSQNTPVPFFATAESHNTPRAASRAGGITFSRMVTVLNAFLPAVYFIHQGFELGETFPVNTGLGFSAEDIARFPSHTLPLFCESALCWNSEKRCNDEIAQVLALRKQWQTLVVNPRKDTFRVVKTSDERVVCYARISPGTKHAIAILVNLDCLHQVPVAFTFGMGLASVTDALGRASFEKQQERFTLTLKPGQGMIFPLTDPPL